MKKYSFVVPVYNAEAYLPGLAEALLAQKPADWEAVFGDDGSTDRTRECLRALCEKEPRFRAVHIDHAGVSAARNAALDAVEGAYVLFLDQDDLICADLLSLVEEEINGADVLVFNHTNTEDGGERTAKREKPFSFRKDADGPLERFLLAHYAPLAGSVWNKVYRKELIDAFRLRFSDENRVGNEDILFGLKYYLHCNSIRYTDRVGYRYFQRAGSLSHQVFDDVPALKRFPDCALEFADYCAGHRPEIQILPIVFLYKELMLGLRSYLGDGGEKWLVGYCHERFDTALLARCCHAAAEQIAAIERLGPAGAQTAALLLQSIADGNTENCEELFAALLSLSKKRRRNRMNHE